MRIISGKWGGRKLVSFKADHIRPTTDRIKGSIFNRLGESVIGARVLDLFAGTGSLGLEALSRGARAVVAVESSRKSVDILRKNLAALGVAEGYRLVAKDVVSFLGSYKEDAFDIILADPPFTEKMAHTVMESLANSAVVREGSLIIIEAHARERLESVYGTLRAKDIRDYGDKKVGFFTCSGPKAPLQP